MLILLCLRLSPLYAYLSQIDTTTFMFTSALSAVKLGLLLRMLLSMCYRWHCKKCQVELHQQRGNRKEEELDVEAFAGGAYWLQLAMHTRVEFPSVWGIRLSC